MTHLDDILDPIDLEQAIDGGFVRERTHPDDPALRILNYTERAQYENVWTPATRNCRGLIHRDGYVVARPWAKFFNYGQHPDKALDLQAPVQVTDKMDGSLGILYWAPDGEPAIATRGSFASEQAIHATQLLRTKYADWQPSDPWSTYLFEIVYPENRIVVDYGQRDDLVLLGAVDIETGADAWLPNTEPDWPGPRTTVFPAETLADALAMPPRPNAEGVVVLFEGDMRVKVKQDDYLALHRIITGLSERSVWEHLASNGGTYTGLLESIPDEFHGWVTDKAEALRDRHAIAFGAAQARHEEILDVLGDGFERREYAAAAAESPHRALLFQLLDGRDPSPAIWKTLRPVGATPMRPSSEETA
ncbi:RNA ligase [Xylanimonas protaetiae]|uniref:2'-5' RNA ligase n=1 Tax=Xylanimonas protaetiae TaxID=2509457 RepID=A0A4P6F9I4_9MICO|nr:RNA ligase [Xylanimonas protaetiae]QAY70027.1 2'-5' RNA ligase [Xylanimonas protaetiae]